MESFSERVDRLANEKHQERQRRSAAAMNLGPYSPNLAREVWQLCIEFRDYLEAKGVSPKKYRLNEHRWYSPAWSPQGYALSVVHDRMNDRSPEYLRYLALITTSGALWEYSSGTNYIGRLGSGFILTDTGQQVHRGQLQIGGRNIGRDDSGKLIFRPANSDEMPAAVSESFAQAAARLFDSHRHIRER